MENPNIKYHMGSFDTLRVTETNEKGVATKMEIGKDAMPVIPTQRFIGSLTSNYGSLGLSTKLFNLFSHKEVFDRMSDRCSEGFGYATYEKGGKSYLLGARKPGKALAQYDGTMEMLHDNDGQEIRFNPDAGTITSWHTPQHVGEFQIGGDMLTPKFVTEIPIDGFGQPQIYLSMIRQVCTNGMIGYGKAFRTQINLGTADADVIHSVARHIDSYNNEEGFEAIQSRLDASTQSWASIGEVAAVTKLLSNTAMTAPAKAPERFDFEVEAQFANSDAYKVNKAFRNMTGDIQNLYGLASLDALSKKKLAAMPAHCTMYELLNFTTEVATHFVKNPNEAKKFQAQVGNFLGNEYDLEGTKAAYPDFADWYVGNEDYATERQEILAS